MINFEELSRQLLAQARTLLPIWLPGGNISGNEYECGDLSGGQGKSLRFNLIKGIGQDFATGQAFGDMIDLYAQINGISQGDAAKALNSQTNIVKKESKPARIPADASPEIPNNNSFPDTKHFKHGTASAEYLYKNQADQLMFVIARYETADGKQFTPYTYPGGQWHKKAWPKPRPLFLSLIHI